MSRRLPGRIARHSLTTETRGFLRDTSALGMSSAVSLAGQTALVALLARDLGIETYGTFVVVVASVEFVSRFLDVQIGQIAIAFGAEHLDTDAPRAAGILQFCYLVDLLAGLVGFAVVAALAPFVVQPVFDLDPSLVVLYGLVLLATTVDTTSLAVLRLTNRFRLIFQFTTVREVIRIGLVGGVLLGDESLPNVILALVATEAIASAVWLLSAAQAFRTRTGRTLVARALDSARPLWRAMLRMALHTNVLTYVKILAAQGPTLLLGALRGPTEAGAFKIGTAVAAVIAKPADVAWAAGLPRFARLRSAGRMAELRALVRQASVVAFAVIGAAGLVAILARDPIVRLFAGAEAEIASTVVVFAVLQKVVNGTLFWNTPLVLAFKRADIAAWNAVAAALISFPVLVIMTDRWGAAGAAAAMLVWTTLSNVTLAALCLRLADEADSDGSRLIPLGRERNADVGQFRAADQ